MPSCAPVVDCLVFVEDPGAANYVAAVIEPLEARGYSVVVLAAGIARTCLVSRGFSRHLFDIDGTPADLLQRFRPRVLLVGTASNPDTPGLALVSEARRLGIPSVGLVDVGMNTDLRFRGRADAPLAHAPDWLLVPDDGTKRDFAALGFSEHRIRPCENPHFTEVRSVARQLAARPIGERRQTRLADVDPQQPLIVFATEREARAEAWNERLGPASSARRSATRRMEVVLDALFAALPMVAPRPCLVLRLHPKDRADEYGRYLSRVDRIDSGGSPLELVSCADVVIGATSMLLVEAALMGVPALAMLPDPSERGWLPDAFTGVRLTDLAPEAVAGAISQLLACEKTPAPRVEHDDGNEPGQRVAALVNELVGPPVHEVMPPSRRTC